MTLSGHGKCIQFLKNLNIPIAFIGGGGYTIQNAARWWCNETSLILGK